MNMKIKLLIIICMLSGVNARIFSQDCKLNKDIKIKTEYTDSIYEVKYKGMGKYPFVKKIIELGYVPNTSLSIEIANCDYYLPIINNPKLILFLNTINDGDMIKIKIRFFRNKKNKLLQPIVVIQDILKYGGNE